GVSTVHHYMQPPEHGSFRIPQFTLDYFRYDRLIMHYVELFGRENVLVLPYELFQRDPRDYMNRLAIFADVANDYHDAFQYLPFTDNLNQSISAFEMCLWRWGNWVFGKR